MDSKELRDIILEILEKGFRSLYRSLGDADIGPIDDDSEIGIGINIDGKSFFLKIEEDN